MRGGPRVQKHVVLFLKILWSRMRCKKPHQNISFVAIEQLIFEKWDSWEITIGL